MHHQHQLVTIQNDDKDESNIMATKQRLMLQVGHEKSVSDGVKTKNSPTEQKVTTSAEEMKTSP